MRHAPGGSDRIARACWHARHSSAPPPMVPWQGVRSHHHAGAGFARGGAFGRDDRDQGGRARARAARASSVQSAIPPGELRDGGEDALGRGGGVEGGQTLCPPTLRRSRRCSAENTEMASISGGSPTALER